MANAIAMPPGDSARNPLDIPLYERWDVGQDFDQGLPGRSAEALPYAATRHLFTDASMPAITSSGGMPRVCSFAPPVRQGLAFPSLDAKRSG